jgi:hypothetical protein
MEILIEREYVAIVSTRKSQNVGDIDFHNGSVAKQYHYKTNSQITQRKMSSE